MGFFFFFGAFVSCLPETHRVTGGRRDISIGWHRMAPFSTGEWAEWMNLDELFSQMFVLASLTPPGETCNETAMFRSCFLAC